MPETGQIRVLLLANWGLGQRVLQTLSSHPACRTIGVVTRGVSDRDDRWSSVVSSQARSLGLRVWETARGFKAGELERLVAREGSDAIISVSFHRIVQATVLKGAELGGFNLHPSLLPRYRGPSPLQWAILNGDRETGLSYHRMTDEVDSGPVLLQRKVSVGDEDVPAEVIEKMKEQAGPITLELVELLKSGDVAGTPQDESRACAAPRLTPEDAVVDWKRPLVEVVNRIRAFDEPYDGARAFIEGKPMRVRGARFGERAKEYALPGTVLERGRSGLVLQAGGGTIRVSAIGEDELKTGLRLESCYK